MLDALIGANPLQRPIAPRFANPEAEDRYYQSHEPRRRRFSALAPLAAIVGFMVIVIEVVPR